MTSVQVQELIDAGCHFGHRASRWNPKMGQYIHGKRNLIHILDLVETIKGLTRASHFLRELCATGRQVVVVGTKRQIKNVVESESQRAEMPYVCERWLGGTLTNFTTIRSRLKRLEELEELESSGMIHNYKKKEQSSLSREMKRIKKNLEGIRKLERIPGALLVIDPKKEYISVREANRLGIPIVAILDTDCDPDQVDLAIPANDDAMKSVALLLRKLVDAMLEGRANYREGIATPEEEEIVVEMKRKERPQQRRAPRRDRPADRPDAAPAAASTETAAAAPAEVAAAPASEPVASGEAPPAAPSEGA
jgi:small subunit ribosomal protein S2